jgi:hypothetical protein
MKEEEIRPKDLFERYIELSKADANLLDRDEFDLIPECLACKSAKIFEKFKKFGFSFFECSDCGSLFCNPRPTREQLSLFYSASESSRYWSNIFLPAVEQSRNEKLYEPKAEKLLSIINNHKIDVSYLCDSGAGIGLFLDAMRKKLPETQFCAIEPNVDSCRILKQKGYTVYDKTLEEVKGCNSRFDMVACLEVFEHVQKPELFARKLAGIIKNNKFCLITTLGYEGFDIQILGENSNSISPPHHLNFFSIEGFRSLFTRAGFNIVEISTPGLLDVDIVLNHERCPEFLHKLAKRGEVALNELQNLLVRHSFSSHTWILLQKK